MSINLYKKKTDGNNAILEEILSKDRDTVANKPLVYDSTKDNVKSTDDLNVNTVTANTFCGELEGTASNAICFAEKTCAEWKEIIKETCVDNAACATTATNLDSAPQLEVGTVNCNKITVTAGNQKSEEFTVPYSTHSCTSSTSNNSYCFDGKTYAQACSDILSGCAADSAKFANKDCTEWKDIIKTTCVDNADNATCFNGKTYVCACADILSGTANNATCFAENTCTEWKNIIKTTCVDNAASATNSTCFGGCTYAQACSDIRSGLATQSCANFIQSCVIAIENKIPAEASASNQLADKAFVNSSIATNTANFRGTYACVACLPTTGNTNNDYAFVCSLDTCTGNYIYDRYKWVGSDSCWVCEYELNTTGFTACQLAAINSGITDTLVAKITDVYDNKVTVCMNGLCKGSFNLNQNVDTCIDLGCIINNATCFNDKTYSEVCADILTGNAESASNVMVQQASNSEEKNIAFLNNNIATGTKGKVQFDSDKKITYNPSTNILTVPTVCGNLCGNVTGNLTGNANTASSATNATCFGGKNEACWCGIIKSTKVNNATCADSATSAGSATTAASATNSTCFGGKNEACWCSIIKGTKVNNATCADSATTAGSTGSSTNSTCFAGKTEACWCNIIKGTKVDCATCATAATIAGSAISASYATDSCTSKCVIPLSVSDNSEKNIALLSAAATCGTADIVQFDCNNKITYNPSTDTLTVPNANICSGTICNAVIQGSATGAGLTFCAPSCSYSARFCLSGSANNLRICLGGTQIGCWYNSKYYGTVTCADSATDAIYFAGKTALCWCSIIKSTKVDCAACADSAASATIADCSKAVCVVAENTDSAYAVPLVKNWGCTTVANATLVGSSNNQLTFNPSQGILESRFVHVTCNIKVPAIYSPQTNNTLTSTAFYGHKADNTNKLVACASGNGFYRALYGECGNANYKIPFTTLSGTTVAGTTALSLDRVTTADTFTYNAMYDVLRVGTVCGLLKAGCHIACTPTITGQPGTYVSTGSIEMMQATPYIDFHHNNACADYSARLINSAAGKVDLIVNNATGCCASTSSSTFSLCSNGTLAASNLKLQNTSSVGSGVYLKVGTAAANADRNIIFTPAIPGNNSTSTDEIQASTCCPLTFNPATGVLTAACFCGAVSAPATVCNATTIQRRQATTGTCHLALFSGKTAETCSCTYVSNSCSLTYQPATGVLTADTFCGTTFWGTVFCGTASCAYSSYNSITINRCTTNSSSAYHLAMFSGCTYYCEADVYVSNAHPITYVPNTGRLTTCSVCADYYVFADCGSSLYEDSNCVILCSACGPVAIMDCDECSLTYCYGRLKADGAIWIAQNDIVCVGGAHWKSSFGSSDSLGFMNTITISSGAKRCEVYRILSEGFCLSCKNGKHYTLVGNTSITDVGGRDVAPMFLAGNGSGWILSGFPVFNGIGDVTYPVDCYLPNDTTTVAGEATFFVVR